MSMIRVERFGGMIPLWEDRLLPDYHAAFSQNTNVQSGRLQTFSALVPIYTLQDPTMKSVFRVPKVSPGIDNMADSYWLEFPIENTWVVRNPTTGLDDDGRYYWADGSNLPGYTTGSRLEAGQPPLVLGIPTPETAPGVTSSGGTSSTTETRAYVYTWVSASGEEGPPSPPTVHTGLIDDTWHIAVTPPLPADLTNRTLTTWRLYRTVTDQTGTAQFYFVSEHPLATTTWDDTIADGTVALNDMLASTTWTAPPDDLNGLVSMPNGMIAGFRNNEVWFCEPYRPHAWPPQYVLGVESPIVGLGVQQQSLIILTTGWTYIATGISPDAMALTKVANLEPCTSMGSIVSSPDGVMYTSVNGLIVCNAGVEVNGTANLVRKDEWPQLLYLPNLHAVYINRSYLAFSAPNEDGVFQADTFQVPADESDPLGAYQTIDFTGSYDGGLISLQDERTAYQVMASDIPVANVLQDLWTGEVMLLRDGVVEHLDLRQPSPIISNYLWRSKIWQTPFKQNWAAAKVFFTNPPFGTPTGPTYFRFYADGIMIYQRALDVSGKQFRLPSGYKSDTIQFEIEGQLEIFNVQIATSAHELRQQ